MTAGFYRSCTLPRVSGTQRGIALIQVLILSVVLSVLLVSMNHQAKQHLKLAQAVRSYTQANFALHSAESEIIFTMLSNEPYKLMQNKATESSWNYHGEPFSVGDVDIVVQDTSGLLNAASPDPSLISAFFASYTDNAAKGRQFIAALGDWQDKDDTPRLDGAELAEYPDGAIRNGPVQYTEEWLMVKGMTTDVYQNVAPLLTFFTQGVNLNQQPEAIWRLYMSEEKARQLSQLRHEGKLTPELFTVISGIEVDEFNRFSVGPGYKIGFTVKNADVRLSRELTLRLMPFQQQPFDIYEYRLRNLPTDTLHAASMD